MRILQILVVFLATVVLALLFGSIFTTNMLKAGWMVSVDAALFIVPLSAAATLVSNQARLRAIVLLITLAHTVFGYLGLGVHVFGQYESGQLGWSIWPILGVATLLGLRFIVDGLSGEEEDDGAVEKLAAGLLSLVALTLYYNVSVDEFFAVLQRYQWMKAQGWDHATMALNIGLSMVVLWCILALVQHFAGSSLWLHDWCEKHGDRAMFVVFSLIMYYMVRGILQNGLGYEPWQDKYTGLAPSMLVVGFILTWLLKQALKLETVRTSARKIFFLGD